MYKNIIQYIMDTALMHKAVNSTKFQGRQYINQQNGNGYMQFIVEDNVYSDYKISSNTFTMTLNIDILCFPTNEYTVLDIQNDTFQVGNEILAYIIKDKSFKNLLDIYDYSFLSLSEFTDDRSAGQRLTLELVIPNPVNRCSLDDNFIYKGETVVTDNEITLQMASANNHNSISLKPIRL